MACAAAPHPTRHPLPARRRARRLRAAALVLLAGLLLGVSGVALPAGAAAPAVRLVDEVLVISRGEAAVEVFQLFTLMNEGDAPDPSPLLPVAEDAVWLRVARLDGGAGGEVLLERAGPGGLPRDPEPLAPGERRSYQATYRLWQSSWPVALRRPLPYPSGDTTILTRPGELAAGGLKVTRDGTTQMEGVPLEVYRVETAEPVDRWQVLIRPAGPQELPVLAGAQAPNPLRSLREGFHGWLVGLAGAAVVAGLLLAARRRRGPLPRRASRREAGADLLAPWVDRLAALDLAFQRGELPEEAYRREREALLAAFRRAAAKPPGPASAAAPAGHPPSVDRG